jgi:hypothetical protein
MIPSIAAPDASRTEVKVAGSTSRGPSAARVRSEFAAKQTRVISVRTAIRTGDTAG